MRLNLGTVFFCVILLDSVQGLICDCDLRYCEVSSCQTDGVCFASLKRNLKTGRVNEVRRCIDKVYLVPLQRPFVCEYNHHASHIYACQRWTAAPEYDRGRQCHDAQQVSAAVVSGMSRSASNVASRSAETRLHS